MSDVAPNFQPRSEFVRTEANPQSYALVALNGTDTLRCHGISPNTLSALREVFGGETRLYGEDAETQTAEFVFRNSPWSNKTIRSETLIANMFAVLLVHQYTFLTTIDYGRQYFDKLSLTFTRPTSISNPSPATESVFALSFTAPTTLRVVAAPLHATPAILQSVRGAWPRGVKSERKLGNGSWEFRLKGFGYFSTEKSDEAVLPHVFTLLRALDSHAFRLLAAVPIGARSRAKDLWLFSAPGASRPGRNSPGGSTNAQGTISNAPTSPYQATIDSSEPYSPNLFSPTSPGHAKYATDEPERTAPLTNGHVRSPSSPVPGSVGSAYRKPAPMFVPSPGQTPPVHGPTSPSPMTMPVPVIAQPVPPASPRSNLAQPETSLTDPSAVPVPIPMKRNSSLLRKFRGNGKTASGGFKHPPPPPGFKSSDSGSVKSKRDSTSGKSKRDSTSGKGSLTKRGHGRQRSLASGEIIYETPTPQKSVSPSPNPTPNPPAPEPPVSPSSPNGYGFVAPPPPPPIPQSPTSAIPKSPIMTTPEIQAAPMPVPVPAITTTSPSTIASPLPQPRPDILSTSAANRTTEELLLPRGAFRDSAFSTNTDLSHDVAIIWTGNGKDEHMGLGGVKEEVEGEVEARSPDVMVMGTRDGGERPKSEKAELAIVEPGPPPPLPPSALRQGVSASASPEEQKQEDDATEKQVKQPLNKPNTPNEWVFVSVDKGKGSESSGSPPEETPPTPDSLSPPPPPPRKGSFKRWFGGGGGGDTKSKPKSKVKPTRRRGAMVPALRSSKRLSIE